MWSLCLFPHVYSLLLKQNLRTTNAKGFRGYCLLCMLTWLTESIILHLIEFILRTTVFAFVLNVYRSYTQQFSMSVDKQTLKLWDFCILPVGRLIMNGLPRCVYICNGLYWWWCSKSTNIEKQFVENKKEYKPTQFIILLLA